MSLKRGCSLQLGNPPSLSLSLNAVGSPFREKSVNFPGAPHGHKIQPFPYSIRLSLAKHSSRLSLAAPLFSQNLKRRYDPASKPHSRRLHNLHFQSRRIQFGRTLVRPGPSDLRPEVRGPTATIQPQQRAAIYASLWRAIT